MVMIMICDVPLRWGRSRRNFRRGEDGFTLVELLVVLGIIALIAGIVTPQVLGYLRSARIASAGIQIKSLHNALELYFLDNGQYPTVEEGLAALAKAPAGAAHWNGPYIKNTEKLLDPWGKPYVYERAAESGEIIVRSLGRDGREGGTGEDGDLP